MSNPTRTLVLGTHNQKKRRELEVLLTPHGFELLTLADFSNALEVEETGDTFAANAQKKASEQAVHLGKWVMGEDSGISVDALDGQPGVYSARYSDPGATDERNNEKLLRELGTRPQHKRTAFYTCHIALSDPTGEIRLDVEDYCRGRIAFEEAGSGGFGYDPLFIVREYHQTFGQLGDAVKTVLSHRSRAIRRFIAQIPDDAGL